MDMKKFGIIAVAFLTAFCLASSAADAAKKKAPPKKKIYTGGQMQLKGTDGTTGEWLFNGSTRLNVTSVVATDQGPKGEKPDEGKKWIVVSVQLKNGTDQNANYGGSVESLTLVDSDGQSVAASRLLKSDNWDEGQGDEMILPAALMKGVLVVAVASDYKPVRLVYQHAASEPVFRVSFKLIEKTGGESASPSTLAPAEQKSDSGAGVPQLPQMPQLPQIPQLPGN
ncbi:MAG TPA: DUF4352 domain-containing protein [Candidatus Omnitrophota bacterium]|nr:DUF4352 domain-containing protein [Candidatus Omnitrophota bacterium]